MSERIERCETCYWWEPFGTGYEAGFGWCHRHAPHKPTNVIQGKCETVGIWPNPEASDYCGEWELKQGANDVRLQSQLDT